MSSEGERKGGREREREKKQKKNNFSGLISNVDILYRFSFII